MFYMASILSFYQKTLSKHNESLGMYKSDIRSEK